MKSKYLRVNEETMNYWETIYSAKSFEKDKGRFIETRESRIKRKVAKPQLRIREMRYKEITPEEENERRKKLQDLMVTILWEYNNNFYEDKR